MMNAKPTPRVLLVAWDGAEWDVIAPLLESGDLPNCERLIDRGVMGKMATLHSALAPLAWNSVATGRPPEEHGILGYKEPAPDGRSVRPFSSAARRTRTLWDILSEHGFKTHVIGWPASHPAERVNGLAISEVFDEPVGELQAPWPVAADSVAPADRVETFAELRMHPGEITRHDLRTFVPEIDSVNPREEPAVLRLAQAIALAASRQALATYVMENEPWNFFALYQPTLERISREFLQFHPPQLAGIGQREFERYRGVVRESYRFHDAMLGRLLELAGDETTILLSSTCGFHTGALRAPVKSPGTARFAAQHRSAGWFVLHGPAVRADELIFGSRLYDIVPTVLTLFGLPVGRDMPGRVWQEAFLDPLTTTFLPTWETRNARPAGMPAGPAEGRASARPGPAEKSPSSLVPGSAAFVAARENHFNLARCLQSAGRPAEALPLLEEVCSDLPERIEPVQQLCACYRALGRTAESRRVLERLARLGESTRRRHSSRFVPQLDLMRGLLDLDDGKSESALRHFAKAQEAAPQLPGMHLQLGGVYLRLHLHDPAANAFRAALEIDPDAPAAHYGLSLALYRQRRFPEAGEHAMQAAARAPWFAAHHLQLGLCLARTQRKTEAIVALTHAVQCERRLLLAHRVLARLHAQPPPNRPAADFHRTAVRQLQSARRAENWLTHRRAFD